MNSTAKILTAIMSVTLVTQCFSESKIIDSFDIKSFYSSYDNVLIPNAEGINLKKGMNIYSYQSGYINNGKNLSVNYELKENLNPDISKLELNKLYVNYENNIFSISFGKMTKTIGPSKNSIILSNNYPPLLMIDIFNKKPLRLWGSWRFELTNLWLNEDRKDVSNPEVIILRADYKPVDILNIGFTRVSEYGGDGRPNYKLWEYPKLLLGGEDNVPYSKYDGDGYGGYDITLNLEKYFNSLDELKIYYQDIGTDLVAPWQKEDSGEWKFPFILKRSRQAGVEIIKSSDTYNIEFTNINYYFYIHHIYWYEGYTYKGFSLGYPYGKDLNDIYFSHRHIFGSNAIKYKIGYMKQPVSEKANSKYSLEKYYIEAEYQKKIRNCFIIPYLRIERNNNKDTNPLPTLYRIVPENNTTTVLGLETKFIF